VGIPRERGQVINRVYEHNGRSALQEFLLPDARQREEEDEPDDADDADSNFRTAWNDGSPNGGICE